MLSAGKVAVGRFSTRGRQQLVLIRPVESGLMMHGLHYADEVRSFDDIELERRVEFKPGELDLAGQLIEQLSSASFEPRRYEDEYRRDVLAQIERKVAGQEITAAPAAEQREQIIDLVAALKKSLTEKREGAPAKVARERKPAKAKGRSEPARARSGSS